MALLAPSWAPPLRARRSGRARAAVCAAGGRPPAPTPNFASTAPSDVLGVARGAAKDDARRAYRALALKYHPDRNSAKDVRS